MKESKRNETILNLFTIIRGVMAESNIIIIKKYVMIGYQELKLDDDYIKSLVMQLLCVSYIRLYELLGSNEDSFGISSKDIGLEGEDVLLFVLNPVINASLISQTKTEVNEKVQKKLDFIMHQFTRVPCVSAFCYNHQNLEYNLNSNLIYNKEELEKLLPLNKAYAQYFYLHMFEFFNTYACEKDQINIIKTYTVEKYISILNDIEKDLNVVFKEQSNELICDISLNVLLNYIYRFDNKEITFKCYNILEKILRHVILVKKLPHLKYEVGMELFLDLDILKILNDVAKENNKNDYVVYNKLNNSYRKLVNDVKLAQTPKVEEKKTQQPKPQVNKKNKSIKKRKKIKEELTNSKTWIILAIVSFVEFVILTYLWWTFEKSITDTSLAKQIMDIINSVVIKIDKGLEITTLDSRGISNMFLCSSLSSLVIFILYILLGKKVDSDNAPGKVMLFIVCVLYGLAKLPISLLVSIICICKSKDYLPYESKLLKFLVSLVPISVFILSIIFI